MGNVCVRDYQPGAVCTANDVRIEALEVVSVIEDCASGVVGEAEVVMRTLVSSAGSPNRYDIGIFVALDGGSARDGDSCFHDYLDPPLTPTPTLGDFNTDGIADLVDAAWWEGDTDSCGDIQSNTQIFKTLPALRFACIDSNGDGSVDAAVASSWDNNAVTNCSAVTDAFPSTNSKCSTGIVEFNISPYPEITVSKDPAVQNVSPGDSVDFNISVTSRTTLTSVVIDDPQCDAISGPTGDVDNDGIILPGEVWNYTCTVNNALADFTNTVTARATAPGGPVEDTDTADVIVSNGVVGISKRLVSVTATGVDIYDVAMSFIVENLGNEPLDNLQVTDDLSATVPAPATYSIISGPTASGTLSANAGFDGSGDTNLLQSASSTLAVGATGSISLVVRIALNGASGPFLNTATVTGTDPLGTPVIDTSDDGTDPDPDGDNNPNEPGENDPTPITFVPFAAPVPAPPAAAPATPPSVPMLPGWGILLLAAITGGVGFRVLRKR